MMWIDLRRFTFLATLILAPALTGCGRKDASSHTTGTASNPPPSSAPSGLMAIPAQASVVVETKAMGTLIRIVTYPTQALNEAATRRSVAKAMEELRRIETLMSPRREDSDVSRINHHAGTWVPVSQDTFRVVEKGLWAGSVSGGTFDITWATMADLWKFGETGEPQPALPSADEVTKRRALVDYSRVEIRPTTLEVRIPEGRRVGLGGIAKGYGVDRAADVLRREGLRSFLFQAGGDIFASGTKPDGTPWVTGIMDPRGPEGSHFATLELGDCALSTAGDYERYYIANGKRYHHIIDPRTGYPATASRSVSVIAPSAMVSDAIDDAVFILGPEKGMALVESLPDVGAVIVDGNNKVWISERLRGKVTVIKEPTP